jgi:putative serine protease PepD
MFNPVRTGERRYPGLSAALIGAIIAGVAVAAVALATDPTPSSEPSGTPASLPVLAGAPVGRRVPASALALQGAFVNVVQSVSPSVVQIEDHRGLGSGIVFDASGHIVTNNHVVSGASSWTVTTSSGTRYQARLVGSFPADDLAVIKISGSHLQPATFADSSKLHVGDLAIAIGNPLGLQSSVTEGIVSAFREAVQEDSSVTLPMVIQTSAEINPGNSGGALVDIEGRVIGIPTLAATDPQLGGSAAGIGFALPSNLVKDIAGQIVANGKVVDSHRAFLGIRVGDTNGRGVLVGAVTAGGAAARAGMRVGDVITSVDGTATSTSAELSAVLADLKPGQRVLVVVRHQNGRRATFTSRSAVCPEARAPPSRPHGPTPLAAARP